MIKHLKLKNYNINLSLDKQIGRNKIVNYNDYFRYRIENKRKFYKFA